MTLSDKARASPCRATFNKDAPVSARGSSNRQLCKVMILWVYWQGTIVVEEITKYQAWQEMLMSIAAATAPAEPGCRR